MTDLDQLLSEIREGAEQRGLQIVDATFPTEPTFALHLDSTSLEDALDLAMRMLAPFISITVEVFDADEFLAEFNEGVPAEAARVAREHHGEAQGLAMRWLGLGATGLFLAGTDWSDALSDFQNGWAMEQQSAWVDERNSRAIRVAYLAEHIERDPRYRGVGQSQRTSVGRVIADELSNETDDATTFRWALEHASRHCARTRLPCTCPLRNRWSRWPMSYARQRIGEQHVRPKHEKRRREPSCLS